MKDKCLGFWRFDKDIAVCGDQDLIVDLDHDMWFLFDGVVVLGYGKMMRVEASQAPGTLFAPVEVKDEDSL